MEHHRRRMDLGRAALQTLANALACSRYHNLMHRHADSVEIAIRSNLSDSFSVTRYRFELR